MTDKKLSAEEMERERAPFEAAMTLVAKEHAYGYAGILFSRDQTGAYSQTWVDSAWIGWLARAALSQQPECGEVLEVMGYWREDGLHWTEESAAHGGLDYEPLCRLSDAQRLLAERDDAIKEWSALAIQRGEERDILQKKLDRFYSQSHGIPPLAEIEKLRARVAELEHAVGVALNAGRGTSGRIIIEADDESVLRSTLNPPQANSQEGE